jgi:hypothetical protein
MYTMCMDVESALPEVLNKCIFFWRPVHQLCRGHPAMVVTGVVCPWRRHTVPPRDL